MTTDSTPSPATPSTSATSMTPEPPTALGSRMGIAAAVIVVLVMGTLWYDNSNQIEQLSREVSSLKDAQRQLQVDVSKKLGGTAAVAPTAAAPSVAIGKTINVNGAPSKGGANAVVTLVEFSDYECPFCIRHFNQTMPRIEADYIKPGKIDYVFRDLPIDELHPQSIRAHIAAKCATEQNKFWELHVHLFSSPGSHQPKDLDALAKQTGMNIPAFDACIASNKYEAAVRASVDEAGTFGANGTPAFFIGLRDLKTNDVKIVSALSGALPYAQFKTALDDALKQSGGK